MKRTKLFVVLPFLALSLFLGGCSLVAQPADIKTESPVVSITGVISGKGNSFSINEKGKLTEITSRKIDLNSYLGKTVTVTGEFSGTTLFVDSVK